ncbi:putative lipid phosphate phosphatase-related protein type 1-like [Triplophysa rosa]|uniref:Phospholipid phosphatase-related protein type 1 n=1 Tax=Triplophysa rosa TaxID=992332 RepID=A0A9W7WC44_TRIRA|nr:putative lipid phosphate phosphatase-related protein type 1-like [Triplophysa rosa]
MLLDFTLIPNLILFMVIMAGTVLLAYYFECTDTFGIHIQGFFCHDADLMKPYPGVEESSFIPPLILYCIVTAAPTTVIFIGEISMYVMKSTREALIAQEKTIVTGECCYLNPLIRRIIRFIVMRNGPMYLGLSFRQGCRRRKSFVDNQTRCPGMYITSTIKTKSSRLAKPVLCLAILCAAFLTGLNRVSEYRNHCSDVVAGFILGSSVALFLGICVVNNFKGNHSTPAKQKQEDYRGLPLITFPRVENPLETLSAQSCMNEVSPTEECCCTE